MTSDAHRDALPPEVIALADELFGGRGSSWIEEVISKTDLSWEQEEHRLGLWLSC